MLDNLNDKDLIILSLTIIAIFAMYMFKDSALPLVQNIVSGLLGTAIGQRLGSRNGTNLQ